MKKIILILSLLVVLFFAVACQKQVQLQVNLSDSRGGVVTINNQTNLTYPGKTGDIVTLNIELNSNYLFEGWYENDIRFSLSLTTSYTLKTKDTLILAKVSLDGETYQITWLSHDGTILDVNPTVPVGSLPIYAPMPPTRPGYLFNGWTPQPVPVTQDATYTVAWEIIQYQITYHLDGGTNQVQNPASFQINTPEITLAPASKSGFVFSGWFTNSNYSTPITTIAFGTKQDIDLYAKFVLPLYSLSFDTNGGTSLEAMNVSQPTSLNLQVIPLSYKNGYLFDGWYLDSNLFNQVTWPYLLNQNKVFYAKWRINPIQDQTYSYMFNQQPGIGEVTLTDANQALSLTWTIPEAVASSYNFDAWEIGAEGLGQKTDFVISTILPLGTILTGYSLVVADASEQAQYYVEFGNYQSGWLPFLSQSASNQVLVTDLGFQAQGQTLRLRFYTPGNQPFYLKGLTLNYQVWSPSLPSLTGTTWTEVIHVMEVLTGIAPLDQVLPASGPTYYLVELPIGSPIIIKIFVNWIPAEATNYQTKLAEVLTNEDEKLWLNQKWTISVQIQQNQVWFELTYQTGELQAYQRLTNFFTLAEYKATLPVTSQGMASLGSYHLPVILIQFPDRLFTADELRDIQIVLNGTSEQTGWESLKTYYEKSSYGKLHLTYDFFAPYTVSQPSTAYSVQEDARVICREAIHGMDGVIDFTQYDFNHDEVIDSVLFLYSVYPTQNTDPLWWVWVSLDGEEMHPETTIDGLYFDYYMWGSTGFMYGAVNEGNGLILNAETFVHETGHLLGLADYYGNYEYMGGFDMMDYNCGDHGPLNKLYFGWIEPYLMTPGTLTYSLGAWEETGDAILIPYDNGEFDPENLFQEYLLIMYYTPTDLYLAHLDYPYVPGEAGLVIYHVDARLMENPTHWEFNLQTNIHELGAQFIRILEADLDFSIGEYLMLSTDLFQNGTVNFSDSYDWNQGGQINLILTAGDLNASHFVVTVTTGVVES